MQYRGECWAGNAYGKHGKRPDRECNMKCRHDNSRMCGAGWRNNVFRLIVKKVVYKSILGENKLGCYQDRGNRDLPKLLRGGYGHPRTCFQMAKDAGYRYAGLQYRGECWAGNRYGKHGKRPDRECNMKCRKDGSRTCGAGWRNEVFDLRNVKKSPVKAYRPIYGE
jgi:hypothetical protein